MTSCLLPWKKKKSSKKSIFKEQKSAPRGKNLIETAQLLPFSVGPQCISAPDKKG